MITETKTGTTLIQRSAYCRPVLGRPCARCAPVTLITRLSAASARWPPALVGVRVPGERSRHMAWARRTGLWQPRRTADASVYSCLARR
jgi:hypothetical protein